MGKDFNIRNIPEDLGKDFKTACAYYTISMKAVLIRHMQSIVNHYRVAQVDIRKYKSYTEKRGKNEKIPRL